MAASSWRSVRWRRRSRTLTRGDASLHDRELLLRVGRALISGKVGLDEVAQHLEVPEPALAAALERLHGVVPAAGAPARR